MNYKKEYWKKRFTNNEPEPIKRAIMAVYEAYPAECLPQGVCDPMYIMNTIAVIVGFGDGQGNFNLSEVN